ncbi:MAG: hypothetical protein AAF467_25005 [Actinomycetota bacterium]
MRRDIRYIVSKLDETFISDDDEQKILNRVEKWHQRDLDWATEHGFSGSRFLDEFLFKLKGKTYTVGLFDEWVNAHDEIWRTLEGSRRSRWQALVSQSKRQKSSGPETERMEGFGSYMGRKTAQGGFGIAKGLSTGLAGMIDAGSWLTAKGLNATLPEHLQIEPLKLRDMVDEGMDQIGDELLFGKDEWSEGEDLFLGMNARDISGFGGEVVWSLTTLGLSAEAQGSRALMALDLAGKVKSVDAAVGDMAAYLIKKGAEGKLTWDELASDPRFWSLSAKLAGSVVGAVAGGVTSKEGAAKVLADGLGKAGLVLQGVDAAGQVGQILAIAHDPKLTAAQREERAGASVRELVQIGVGLAGQAAQKRDLELAQAKAAGDPEAQITGDADTIATTEAVAKADALSEPSSTAAASVPGPDSESATVGSVPSPEPGQPIELPALTDADGPFVIEHNGATDVPDVEAGQGYREGWVESHHYPDVDVGKVRKPHGFSTGRHSPGRRVKAGKGFREGWAEPTAYPKTRRPQGRDVTAEEQVHGINFDWKRTVRNKTPLDHHQAKAQSDLPIGSPDPAFPGRTVTGTAHADHIVGLDAIRRMPGFAELSVDRQLAVANMDDNFVAMSPTANTSKGPKSFADWTRHERLGLEVDPAFRARMTAREVALRPLIQAEINRHLADQLKSGNNSD